LSKDVTELGIIRDDKDEHLEKQKSLRDVNELEIISDDKDEHQEK
jgi:hypothetical protein